MSNNKIYFIGSIQQGQSPTGGGAQVKNQIFLEYLYKRFLKVMVYDTWGKNKIVSFVRIFQIILSANKDDVIVISLSFRGVYQIAKLSKLLKIRRKAYYWVVGGDIAINLQNYSLKGREYLYFFEKIIVQAEYILKDLIDLGIINVEVVPNFKKIDYLPALEEYKGDIVNFVFLSRIISEKGVDLIIEVAKRVAKCRKDFIIDFYGKLDKSYSLKYFSKLRLCNIQYKGFLDLTQKKNYDVLASYDFALFPTFFKGEGFPGILVDNFIAGLPTIVSNFHANPEVIIDFENGFIIETNNADALYEKILYVLNHREIIGTMSKNARDSARKYEVDKVLDDAFIKLKIQ